MRRPGPSVRRSPRSRRSLYHCHAGTFRSRIGRRATPRSPGRRRPCRPTHRRRRWTDRPRMPAERDAFADLPHRLNTASSHSIMVTSSLVFSTRLATTPRVSTVMPACPSRAAIWSISNSMARSEVDSVSAGTTMCWSGEDARVRQFAVEGRRVDDDVVVVVLHVGDGLREQVQRVGTLDGLRSDVDSQRGQCVGVEPRLVGFRSRRGRRWSVRVRPGAYRCCSAGRPSPGARRSGPTPPTCGRPGQRVERGSAAPHRRPRSTPALPSRCPGVQIDEEDVPAALVERPRDVYRHPSSCRSRPWRWSRTGAPGRLQFAHSSSNYTFLVRVGL